MAGIGISSRGIWKNLDKMGFTTEKYKYPVPQLRSNLVRHFIRGLVDGDGSVNFGDSRRNHIDGVPYKNISVTFCGCSFDIINFVNKTMNGYCHKSLSINTRPTDHGLAFYQVQYCGSSAYRVCKQLYKGATVYMDRKYQNFLKMKNYYQHVETERETTAKQ